MTRMGSTVVYALLRHDGCVLLPGTTN